MLIAAVLHVWYIDHRKDIAYKCNNIVIMKLYRQFFCVDIKDMYKY